jgi:predicted branched-subunit amino acid permease
LAVNDKFESIFSRIKIIKRFKSPAIPLAACFVALGALLKDAGFNLQQSAASSLFTYALPGQLVMAESLLVGASLVNIFIAVWLVNFRLYPMTVSLFLYLNIKLNLNGNIIYHVIS